MSWHTFEGRRVFYTREGAGDPIIFLPNATLTGRLWEHQAEHFKATNDVIVVDLPGFGQSDFVRPTLEYNVRWLECFVDDLDVAPAALVGNCVGSLMDIADPRQAEYVEHARRCWSRPETRVAWLSFAYADRRSVRRTLGYDDRRLVMCAVGGTSIGAELLRLCAEAHPHIERRAPGARTVVVCGPRIDPAAVPAPAGVEIRGYVPRLYEHLAASDVAIVQAGGTTTLELTALRRPFLYFPLEGHFEQEHVVAERLARHRAGVRMRLRDTSPEQLADAAVAAMCREPQWPPIPIDGARRAAHLVTEMRRAHEDPTAVAA